MCRRIELGENWIICIEPLEYGIYSVHNLGVQLVHGIVIPTNSILVVIHYNIPSVTVGALQIVRLEKKAKV